jgi:hypothetical protein
MQTQPINYNLVQTEAFVNNVKFQENTESYKHITTEDLQPVLESLGYELFQVTQAKVRKAQFHGFQKHVARFRSKATNFNGELAPEIVVLNAHRGTNALRFLIGAYRTFCANGIVIGDTFCDYRIRHVGEVQEKINTILPMVAARAPIMLDAVTSMKTVNFNAERALEFAEKVAYTRLEDKVDSLVTVDFASLLDIRRKEDTGTDLWTVYNRVQENLFRHGLKYTLLNEEGKTRASSTRKVRENSSAYVEMNQLVWNAAVELV